MRTEPLDVVVIGAGQAGLAVARELSRTSLSFVVLDAQEGPGGAWRQAWDSLRLFSPARWSSLPGFLMPGGETGAPSRDEVIAYLTEYERRYALPVERPVRVHGVRADRAVLYLETSAGPYTARFVVSATGSWDAPSFPRCRDGSCSEVSNSTPRTTADLRSSPGSAS